MGTQHLRDAPALHVPRGGLHQGRRPLLQREVHQQGVPVRRPERLRRHERRDGLPQPVQLLHAVLRRVHREPRVPEEVRAEPGLQVDAGGPHRPQRHPTVLGVRHGEELRHRADPERRPDRGLRGLAHHALRQAGPHQQAVHFGLQLHDRQVQDRRLGGEERVQGIVEDRAPRLRRRVDCDAPGTGHDFLQLSP